MADDTADRYDTDDLFSRRRLLGLTAGGLAVGWVPGTAVARGRGNGKGRGNGNGKGRGNDKGRGNGNGKGRGNDDGDGEDEDGEGGDGEDEDGEGGDGEGEDGEGGDGEGEDGEGGDEGKGEGNGEGSGGPPSDARNTCPDGTVLLAKYELEDGRFVYETESEFLEAGDAFDLAATGTKDGGEVLAFEFGDPQEVYDIHTVSVKTGAGVFQKAVEDYEGSFDARDYDEDDPVQAVSNVLLCSKVFWQVDFGIGEVPEPPDYSKSDALLLRAGLGESTDDIEKTTDDGLGTYRGIEPDPEFAVDFAAGTVEIGFRGNTDGRRLHLASFERPGPFESTKSTEFEYQDLFDASDTTAEAGTLTVDIPTPGDYA
jgi:hypothetical protein